MGVDCHRAIYHPQVLAALKKRYVMVADLTVPRRLVLVIVCIDMDCSRKVMEDLLSDHRACLSLL